MRIYLAGAENPTWRKLLVDAGAKHATMSLTSLRRRLPRNKPYDLAERFPDSVGVGLEPGDLLRRELDDDDLDGWLKAYARVVTDNANRLDYVVEIDAWRDYTRREDARERLNDILPKETPLYVVWRPQDGLNRLEELAIGWMAVALPPAALEEHTIQRVVRGLATAGVQVHALGSTKVDELIGLPLASASSTSWTTPARYGDTIVWDGHRLHRYPADMKDRSRRRHRTDIERAGFDPAKVEADDHDEVLKLAIWSFQQLEATVVATTPPAGNGQDPATGSEKVATTPAVAPQASQLSTREDGSPRVLLPVMRLEATTNDAGEITGHTTHPVNQRPLLQCDTCHIKGVCPESRPGGDCAFDIPLELSTKSDIDRFLVGMIEMQAQRVLFGRFAEQLDGGLPDKDLSAEMDRFFKMVEKLKDYRDNREYLKLQLEGKAEGGMISRIFGERIGGQAGALERPIDANALTATLDP